MTEQNFDYMAEPERTAIYALQAELIRLVAERGTQADRFDTYWLAVKNLGGDPETYAGIFTCLNCGELYHQDYSTALIVDCCGLECEAAVGSDDEDEEATG